MQVSQLEPFYRIHAKFYNVTRRFFLVDRQKAIERLDIQPGHVIIDYGCGTGLNIPFLLQKTAPERIIGIDYTSAMLEVARARYPWLSLIRGDMTTPQLFPHTADRILCTYALSMVDEWQHALLQMKRVLKADGTLVILDFHPWDGAFKVVYPLFRWWLNKHGVDPEQQVVPFLSRHFHGVEQIVLRAGYNSITSGSLR